MENFKLSTFFTFDRNSYLLHASEEKILIYSTDLLNEMQTIRGFSKSIEFLACTVREGIFTVFCENEFLFYFPQYSSNHTLKWREVHRVSFENYPTYACFSSDSEYLAMSDKKTVYIWKISYKRGFREKLGIEGVSEIYRIEFPSIVKKMLFSPNNKHLIFLEEKSNVIELCDLEKLTNQTETLINASNSKDLFVSISEKNHISEMFFRDNLRSGLHTKSPNSLFIVDVEHSIRIWQENILIDPSVFNNACSLNHLERRSSFFRVFLVDKTPSYEESQEKIFVFEPEKLNNWPYGNNDGNHPSVDWFVVYTEKGLSIYEATSLTNFGTNAKISLVKKFEGLEIFKIIKEILKVYIRKKEGKYEVLDLVVLDSTDSILKILLNINEPNEISITNSSKFRLGNILLVSFNKENNTFLVLNDLHQLISLDSISQFSLTDDYNRTAFSQRKVILLNNNLLDSSKFIFHCSAFALFFDSAFQQTYLVHLNPLEILSFKLSDLGVELSRDQKMIAAKLIYLFETPENSEFIFLLGFEDGVFLRFKMKFFNKKVKDSMKNKSKIQDLCIIEEIVIFNTKVEAFSNFKVYFFEIEGQSFDLCIQTNKTLYTFRAEEDQLEKRKDFLFKTNFKEFEKTESTPSLFFFIYPNNEIEFFKEDGELIMKFTVNKLFFHMDQSLLDLTRLNIILSHIYDKNFLLCIENYFLIVSLLFDKKQQAYVIKFLTRFEDSNDLYFKRISRFSNPAKFQVFIGRSKDLFLKTNDSIKSFHGNFEKLIGDPTTEGFDASNIHARLLKTKYNIPYHHPEFIYELLSLGKYNLVEYIFHEVIKSILQKGYVSSKFVIPFTEIMEHIMDEKPIDYNDLLQDFHKHRTSSMGYTKRRSFVLNSQEDLPKINISPETENPLKTLKEFMKNNGKCLSLKSFEIVILDTFIDFLIEYQENQRSLDDFAAIFLFYVKLFKITQRHVGNISKQKCLLTKEICWAMHTLQQDTLINECVDKLVADAPGELSWNTLKKYGVVIWLDTLEKIKSYVELITKNEYAKKQDPLQVTLWYMLLGKKKVLASLFKKDEKQRKTFEFLNQNFNEQRWKNAASKNAYALLAKKNYEPSAGFFILGGYLAEAVNVIVNNLQDIQLGILCCRLLETGKERPIFRKLVEEHFLASAKLTNDCWLSHIGYFLLGEHVNSVNCLYDFVNENFVEYDETGKKSCVTWPSKFEPFLSSFHPAAFFLAHKLKSSLRVKRELQEQEQASQSNNDIFDSFWGNDDFSEKKTEVLKPKLQLIEHKNQHIFYSLEYYLSVNNPILGLVFYMNNKQDIEHNKKITELIRKLLTKYLEFLLEEAVVENDWQDYFSNLFLKIEKICKIFDVKPDILLRHSQKKIQLLRSLKLSVSFLLGRRFLEPAFDSIMDFSVEIQKLFHYSILGNPFTHNPKYFWLDLVYAQQELVSTLNLLNGSEVFQEAFSENKNYKQILNIIELFIFFGLFYVSVNLQAFSLLLPIIEEFNSFLESLNGPQQRKDLFINDKRVDFMYFFNDLKKKTETLGELKQKNPKANKYLDLIAEAFPSNPYQTQQGEQTKVLEEFEPRTGLFQILVMHLASAHFAKITVKQVEKTAHTKFETGSYDKDRFSLENIVFFCTSFAEKTRKAFKSLLCKLSVTEICSFAEEIKPILSNFENIKTHKVLKELYSELEVAILYDVSKRLKFETSFERILLEIQHLLFRTPNERCSKALEEEKTRYFKSGCELIKMRENIKGFCVNRQNNKELIVLGQRRLKRFNLLTQLINKTRSNDGSTLIDEENLINEEENTEVFKNQLDNLDQKPFIVKLCKNLLLDEGLPNSDKACYSSQKQATFGMYSPSEIEELIYAGVNNKPTNDLLEASSIVSHPNLPIFALGNRGAVELFPFCSPNTRLQELLTGNREVVSSLKFNRAGDKVGGADQAGNFFLWKLNKYSKYPKPIFSLYSSAKKSAQDFCFINENSVFATACIGQRPSFSVWDMLLPPNNNLVGSDWIGGTDICYSGEKQILIITNSKKASVSFFDLRKNAVLRTIEAQNIEFRSLLLNQAENLFVAGTNEGTIRLYELNQFELINELRPFKFDANKKKVVSITNLTQVNSALLTSSSEGLISLAYPGFL